MELDRKLRILLLFIFSPFFVFFFVCFFVLRFLMNSKRIPLCSFLGETLHLYYLSTFPYGCSAAGLFFNYITVCFLFLFWCFSKWKEMIHPFSMINSPFWMQISPEYNLINVFYLLTTKMVWTWTSKFAYPLILLRAEQNYWRTIW